MNNLVFLGIAVILSLIGCFVLWFRSRPPRSMEAHIRDFAAELEALAPDRRGSPETRRIETRGVNPKRGRRSG